MKKYVVVVLVAIFIALLFLKFGRSIYMPLINKIKEKETISSISNKLSEKVEGKLKAELDALGIEGFPKKILMVAYKQEQTLAVYADVDGQNKLLKKYQFTATSGRLGPKLQEGDKQIPEGIYNIEYLNPNSSYYLSMKINYPNNFDKEKGKSDGRTNLGNDIFIHGKAATVGCIPVGDDAIEELFILASNAIHNGIKVIIAPKDLLKNKVYPIIDSVIWERDLYDLIYQELINANI